MVSVTSNQADAVLAAAKASQDGVKRTLNPADPTDAAAIKAFLELSGKTPASHPGLYGDLQKAAAGATVGGVADVHPLNIVDQGRDAQGRATARVWHLDQTGAFVSSSLALVLNGETGQPWPSATPTRSAAASVRPRPGRPRPSPRPARSPRWASTIHSRTLTPFRRSA